MNTNGITSLDTEIEHLIQQHADQIEAAAWRVLGFHCPQEMEELYQEVRIAIWHVLEKGEPINQWKAFIYHCAHKRSLDRLKQMRQRTRHETLFTELTSDQNGIVESISNDHCFQESGSSDIEVSIIDNELVRLPNPVRLTVLLRKGMDCTRTEVARMLKCSPATVDYRLRVGLRQLRKRLCQNDILSHQNNGHMKSRR